MLLFNLPIPCPSSEISDFNTSNVTIQREKKTSDWYNKLHFNTSNVTIQHTRTVFHLFADRFQYI